MTSPKKTETRSSEDSGCLLPCFQGCATIMCFTAIYSISSLTTSTLSVYISSQITTLEKQFGFNSSQSGFLLSCNDIGFLTLTLFISYRATTAHIPRTLCLSTILYGVAGILCSCAYFFSDFKKGKFQTVSNESSFYTKDEDNINMCNKNGSSILPEQCGDERPDVIGTSTSFTPVAMAILAIGMILQGIGKAPRTPFTSYYIDENVDKRKTSMYLGVIFSVGIFGPALGFGLGAVFSNMYVTLEDVNISKRDPRYIGAWWLGFLLFGIISIVLALPLFCFPNHYTTNKSSTERKPASQNITFVTHIKGFIATLIRLVKNPCFIFTVLASCMNLFFVAGMVSFLPKYLETQFTIPTWHANLLMGALNVSSASLGTLIGGYVVYKFRMTPFDCIRWVLIVSCVTAVIPILGFFIGCDNPEIIGHNLKGNVNQTTCMESCNCNQSSYFPVCGSDNQNYFSYCHAGCTGRSKEEFTDCSCIGLDATATAGLCKPECNMLYVYISIVLVFALLSTTVIMPDYIFVMRVVDDKDKAMAVAVRSLLNTVLGWFPGPVIVGKIIDTCCVLWNSSCGGIGACAMYDLADFRNKRHAIDVTAKCIAVAFYFLAFMFARKRTELKMQQKQRIEKSVIPEGEVLIEKPKMIE